MAAVAAAAAVAASTANESGNISSSADNALGINARKQKALMSPAYVNRILSGCEEISEWFSEFGTQVRNEYVLTHGCTYEVSSSFCASRITMEIR